jgi:nucleoside-diphosphate-sugar epimerase
MTDHILVTGGAGYLGSILVPALLGQGYKVTVLDNFMFRQDSLAAVCIDPNFDVVRGDARDERVLAPLVKSADAVIPLAALVGAPMCDRDKEAAVSTNRDAIRSLDKLMAPSQRMLVPITNSGYGIGEADAFCTEDSPLNPVSLYGRTKVEAEQIVLARENSVSFRLATAFGMSPRMRLDLLVNSFVYKAVTDSALVLFEAHFRRNFIHVRDIARVFQHGLNQFETMRGRPYNVGLSDANLSKFQLCERIKAQVPNFFFVEADVGEDPDKRDYMVSNERLEATGFQTEYGLDRGITELIKAYRFLRPLVHGNV